jgi:hypothetical protein
MDCLASTCAETLEFRMLRDDSGGVPTTFIEDTDQLHAARAFCRSAAGCDLQFGIFTKDGRCAARLSTSSSQSLPRTA